MIVVSIVCNIQQKHHTIPAEVLPNDSEALFIFLPDSLVYFLIIQLLTNIRNNESPQTHAIRKIKFSSQIAPYYRPLF